MKFRLLFSLILAAFLVTTSVMWQENQQKNQTQSSSDTLKREKQRIPIPTQVNYKMENEGAFEERKEKYQNLIHGNYPDWKSVNQDNFEKLIKQRSQETNTKAFHSYANGEITGEWRERGSTNQAGNVQVSDYDQQSDSIYAISDGGILWKASIDGTGWKSLNDAFILGTRVLEVIRLPSGKIRILASKGHALWYSDDEGQSWTKAGGFPNNALYGDAIDLVQLNDNDSTIVFLFSQVDYLGNGNNKLAYSTDHGANMTTAHTFSTTDDYYTSMAQPYDASGAYILDQNSETYWFSNGNLAPIANNLTLSGSNASQIEASITPTDTVIYALMDDQSLYRSNDGGQSFSYIDTLPVPAWECGISVSIDDPNTLYFGEMELFRSYTGGNSWTKVSDWFDYYSDVVNKIHADIMSIRSFKNSAGDEFTIIPNHGGVSVSMDNLSSTKNIGLSNLNVGQFYDVATSPINASFIFGGTQDQGFQRTGSGIGSSTIGFEQIVSGDYGQQQFSNNGISIWTQYPGGEFSYYSNAITNNIYSFWYDDIGGNDMPNYNWIVPTASAPNPSDDYILVGGGTVNGSSGSHLIKLQNSFGSAIPTEYPFDFNADAGEPIAAVETTPLDQNKWYVSTENGRFYYSVDAGSNWTRTPQFYGPGNDYIYSADIYASRLTNDLVFLGGAGYSGSAAYMSTDGGQSFTAIDNGLPSTAIHELCMDSDENFLFAATDAGPYVYDLDQDEWFYLGSNGAPIQEYITCEYIASESIVRFATWGRGVWDFSIKDESSVEENSAQSKFSLYPNPSQGQFQVAVQKNYNAFIYSISGKQVLKLKLLPGDNAINVNFLDRGTYIFSARSNDGERINKKFILQ